MVVPELFQYILLAHLQGDWLLCTIIGHSYLHMAREWPK